MPTMAFHSHEFYGGTKMPGAPGIVNNPASGPAMLRDGNPAMGIPGISHAEFRQLTYFFIPSKWFYSVYSSHFNYEEH
jgi:hypothetical protein